MSPIHLADPPEITRGHAARRVRGSVTCGKGFTLIEVLVTAPIMAAALLAGAAMLTTASTTVSQNGAMARATGLAQQRIEQLKNVPFAALAGMHSPNAPPAPAPSEEPRVSEGQATFARRTWVQVSGMAPRREAVVSVILEWVSPRGNANVRLDTVIAESAADIP